MSMFNKMQLEDQVDLIDTPLKRFDEIRVVFKSKISKIEKNHP